MATRACKRKWETSHGPKPKGLPNGLHLLPLPGPQHRREAPPLTPPTPPGLVLPRVPPPVAAFAVDTVPTVLSGGAAHRAPLSAATEGALVLQETGQRSSLGNGHQQLSLVTKQESSLASVWAFPSEGMCLRFLSASGCCLWRRAQGPLDVCPSSPALMPPVTGLSNSVAVGLAHVSVFIYFFSFFLGEKGKPHHQSI